MVQNMNLKELERKTWKSYFQDGLWDIFLGMMMLLGGIRGLTDNVWFTLMMLPAILIIPLGKKFITIPRIGYVKFGSERKGKLKKLKAVVIISVFATFVVLLLVLSGRDMGTKEIQTIIQAVGFPLVFSLMAYHMDFERLYVYGLFFAAGAVLWELYGSPIGPIAFSVSGSITLLIGLILLIRLLRDYPIPVEEASDVN
ncbi:MAG: hypothetical protein ACE5K0_03325 [Candidatus Methanofastidiosia archaeon]